VLPLRPSIGNFEFRTVLLSVEYKFKCRWNRQTLAYYLDIREADATPIRFGVKIVLGTYLGRTSTHPLFRRGVFAPRIPQGDDRREAQFDDLGTRVQVWYYTNEEVVAQVVNVLTGNPPPP